jgi:hypothetical protein
LPHLGRRPARRNTVGRCATGSGRIQRRPRCFWRKQRPTTRPASSGCWMVRLCRVCRRTAAVCRRMSRRRSRAQADPAVGEALQSGGDRGGGRGGRNHRRDPLCNWSAGRGRRCPASPPRVRAARRQAEGFKVLRTTTTRGAHGRLHRRPRDRRLLESASPKSGRRRHRRRFRVRLRRQHPRLPTRVVRLSSQFFQRRS